ncbi:MAG: lactate utilization protein [Elusimicrobiota bacterium]
MDENVLKADRILIEKVKEALIKNGFSCEVFETKEEAKDFLVKKIGKGKTVGFGGTMSLKELGVIEEISKNNKIFTHKPEMSLEERRKVWINALTSNFYIASPQAITRDGKLIFVDGTGNRTAAINWGPEELILIAGKNKITKDEEEGLWRSRNISAIRNNIRLGKNNPCVKTGKCEDCSSRDRICNILTVLWKKPKIANITVILINEELGY